MLGGDSNQHITRVSRVNEQQAADLQTLERLHAAIDACIVIDLETTGLNPQTDRIVEVAAIVVKQGKVVDSFTQLVDPQQEIPLVITDLTGISNALVAGEPEFAAIADQLGSFLAKYHTANGGLLPLVAHNVSFDFNFLQHAFVRAQLGAQPSAASQQQDETLNSFDFMPYTPPLVCTAEAARVLIPRERVGRYRLEQVALALQVEHKPGHRAMADALATLDVLKALADLR